MRRLAITALLLAGCGMAGSGGDDFPDWPDAATGGDADPGCYVAVLPTPAAPVAGATVYASASVNGAGGDFLTYGWTVLHDGVAVPYTSAAADDSTIRFDAPTAGPYYVYVEIGYTTEFCPQGEATINVREPLATDTTWRMRFVVPPGSAAPPQERSVVVPSGADFDYGEVALDPGAVIAGTVEDGAGTGVAAYLRLRPTGTPDVVLDGFAGTTGAFEVRTAIERHDLLVIPFRDDLAPRALPSWLPQPGPIVVDAGEPVSGTVTAPSGAPLAGAGVTVRVGGVPSSVATTGADGAFTVRARPSAGAVVTVDVVPPAASGLPRLVSAPAVLDLAQPLAIAYGAGVTTRDLAGVEVQRDGVDVAAVAFTGTIPAAGTVVAGAAQASAEGRIAITATTSGGALPALLVPATELAVVGGPDTPTSTTIDLSTAAPAQIALPAPVTITGRAIGATGEPIAGAVLEIAPAGALASSAGPRRVTAGDDGAFAFGAAPGGSYDLVLVDPAGAHARLRTTIAVVGATDLGDLALPDGLSLRGTVRLAGSSLPGTAVTILCEDCAGEARARPAAETTTNAGGAFRATVLDPGLPE